MANDDTTLSQVPEGVNGYVVEAAASRLQLVMDALYMHGREQCENPEFVEEASRRSRRSRSFSRK